MDEGEEKLGKRSFQQSGEGMINFVELMGIATKSSGSGIFGAKG